VAEEFVERVRYVADITDLQDKLNRLQTEHDRLGNSTDTTSSRMGKAFGRVAAGVGVATRAVGVGVAAAGAAALVVAPKILEQGAALEALGNKSATVFEGSLGSVEAWAAANSKSMGLTQKELVGVAAGIGDLLKPMGFTAGQAASMSSEMMDLSGALSAWTGGQQSSAEVADVLTKAMLGERDGLKSLGISISEADVQARLAANGQSELTGAALEQAKALATQQLIVEKSADAQKAWSDGSMDAIKQQNATKAAIAGVKEAFVQGLYPALQALLPYVSQAAEWLGKHLPAAFEAVRSWVQTHWPTIKQVVMTAVTAIRDGISGFITFITDAWAKWGDEILAVINFVWPYIKDAVSAAITMVRSIIKTVTDLITGDWEGAWNGIKQFLSGVWESIKNTVSFALELLGRLMSAAWDGIKSVVSGAIDAIVGFVTGIPGRIASAAATLWNGVKSAASTAWEGIKTTVSNAIGAIVGFVTGIPGKIGDLLDDFGTMGKNLAGAIFTGVSNGVGNLLEKGTDIAKKFVNAIINFVNSNLIDKINRMLEFTIALPFVDDIKVNPPDIPRIPTFHTGGVVPGPLGRETLALLQAGEVVFTRDQMRSLGQYISQAQRPSGPMIGSVNVRADDPRAFYDESLWRLAG